MICWNVGVAAAAVWAWSVTCPFGRKRDSTSSFQKRTNSASIAARGRMFHVRRRPGRVHSAVAGPRERRRSGSARRRRDDARGSGSPATRAPARQGCAGRARSTAAGASALRRPRPLRRPASAHRRRRCAARAGASRCGTRTAGGRRAAPRRSPRRRAARAARPADGRCASAQRVDRLRRDRHGLARAVAADEPAARGREAERAAARPARRAVVEHRQVAGLVQELEQRAQHQRRLDGAAGDAAVELRAACCAAARTRAPRARAPG